MDHRERHDHKIRGDQGHCHTAPGNSRQGSFEPQAIERYQSRVQSVDLRGSSQKTDRGEKAERQKSCPGTCAYRSLPENQQPWQPNRRLKVIEQVCQRNGRTAKRKKQRRNDRETMGITPPACEVIGADGSNQKMENEQNPYPVEERDRKKDKMRWIEDPGLKTGQNRKSRRHMAIPEGKVS
ncbi:MAG TPA: hypothetical protein VNN77_10690 [candidate division Zixibacteria bacterium]|nr:hypothetical protein [candidate division Zixibacteria bacterium]